MDMALQSASVDVADAPVIPEGSARWRVSTTARLVTSARSVSFTIMAIKWYDRDHISGSGATLVLGKLAHSGAPEREPDECAVAGERAPAEATGLGRLALA